MRYEAVIGLEVHAQLKTRTKLFCRCLNSFGQAPNSLTCPVCLGLPGALPTPNEKAVHDAVRAGLALNCSIQPHSVFSRKNYFYPDLPKGYQISQFDLPLCLDGHLDVETGDSQSLKVRIQRIHIEEDAGKLLHGDNLLTKDGSLVDLNRAGVPLIEIVSHPDLRNSEQAAEYLRALRSILRYVDVCDGNMEEGSLRCDANVSIRPQGSPDLGTKVEIKNMNSFKHVQKAIDYEIERQTQVIEAGQRVVPETRLWNPDRGITTSMRSKEQAHDYRYFPDPDLPALQLDPLWIEKTRETLPELPKQKKRRLMNEWNLPEYDASILTSEKEIADYYETTLKLYAAASKDAPFQQAKTLSNFVMGEVLRIANETSVSIGELKITPQKLASLLALIESGKISGKMSKDVLDEIAKTGKDPTDIVESKGMAQISDEAELRRIIAQVLKDHPGQTADYRAGKEKIFGFLVGQVMKATGGKANPALSNKILIEELKRGV